MKYTWIHREQQRLLNDAYVDTDADEPDVDDSDYTYVEDSDVDRTGWTTADSLDDNESDAESKAPEDFYEFEEFDDGMWEEPEPPRERYWRIVQRQSASAGGKVLVQYGEDPNKFDQSFGHRPASNHRWETALCNVCEALQETGSLSDGFNKLSRLGQAFSAGYLKDIYQRQHCGLCKAISVALPRTVCGSRLLPKGDNTKLALQLHYPSVHQEQWRIKIVEELDTSGPPEDDSVFPHSGPGPLKQTMSKDVISEIYLQNVWERTSWQHFVPEEPLEFNRGKVETKTWPSRSLVGRDDSQQEYLSAVRAALKKCETTHRSCGELLPRANLPENLLLIDIARRCLVPPPPEARYLALSYVWGSINMFQTTTETIDELQTPQSLTKYAESLPRVVRDAMDVAEAMDIPFLWVDALCIVQDDVLSKHDQIRQMHAIYGQAVLTLVAMHGNHADVGLFERGISDRFCDIDNSLDPRDCTVVKLIGHESLLPRVPWLSELLTASPYNKRGWTFQERILSVRCLYFAEERVYFQCSQDLCDDRGITFDDNLDEELRRLNPFVAAYKAIYKVKSVKRSTWKFGKGVPRPRLNKEQFAAYASLLSEYTTKQLSYESDILNAFAGILNQVFEGQSQAICGLPERDFDKALLWFHEGNPTERLGVGEYLTSCADSAPHAPHLFPSWSWVGWKDSSVVYPIDNVGETSSWETRRLKSCIDEFRIQDPGVEERIVDVHRDLHPRGLYGIDLPDDTRMLSHVHNRTTLLTFRADFVSLSDLRIGPASLTLGTDPQSSISIYPLLDPQNRRCGTFISSFQQIQYLFPCSWILLSQNQNLVFRQSASQIWHEVAKQGVYDQSVFLDGEWVTGNVMLVKWKGDGVARRVGLGFVHLDGWDRVCGGCRVVRLI